VIERQQHVGRDHALDEVVGREDDVVAGIALAQLGEQLLVAREQVVAHGDAGGVGEVVERVLADVCVPIVDVDLTALRHARTAERGQGGGDAERTGDEAPSADPRRQRDLTMMHGEPPECEHGRAEPRVPAR
jgi:hypothetical protein